MKKTLNTLNIGLWLWIATLAYFLLAGYSDPVFLTSAITNATVFMVGRIVVRQLSNLRVEVQLNGKDVGNVEH